MLQQLVTKYSNLCDHGTERRMDGQMTYCGTARACLDHQAEWSMIVTS